MNRLLYIGNDNPNFREEQGKKPKKLEEEAKPVDFKNGIFTNILLLSEIFMF